MSLLSFLSVNDPSKLRRSPPTHQHLLYRICSVEAAATKCYRGGCSIEAFINSDNKLIEVGGVYDP